MAMKKKKMMTIEEHCPPKPSGEPNLQRIYISDRYENAAADVQKSTRR